MVPASCEIAVSNASPLYLPSAIQYPETSKEHVCRPSRCLAACFATIWSTLSGLLVATTGGLKASASGFDLSASNTVRHLGQKLFSLTDIHNQCSSPRLKFRR
jgi:hypothetical protein